jgi:hypothetical protein
MDLSINISADTVAWYGAILATIAGAKTLYDWWSDRNRLKIEWQFDMRMQGEDDVFFMVTAINKGKRPIKITHVAVKEYGKKEVALLGHSFTNEEQRILTDERPATQYPTVQHDLAPDTLWFVIMYDARGREYRRYNPETTPLFKRWYYRFRKPKTNVVGKK